MNKLEYNNAGGFPMTTNRLEDIQETYTPPINGLAAMAGDLAIISGCNESGNNIITDGFIFINGEIFEFRGGIKLANITLFEEKINKEFENGKQKVVITKRYFTFGTGAQNYKWEDFKRIPALNTLQDLINDKAKKSRLDALEKRLELQEQMNMPRLKGLGVELYIGSRSDIPAGYIIVGEYINKMLRVSDEAGKEGGNDHHYITKEQVPPVIGTVDIIHPYVGDIIGGGFKGGGNKFRRQSVNINNSGGGQPIPTIPRYRSIILIKWVGIGNGING